jgi:hypothetical protein
MVGQIVPRSGEVATGFLSQSQKSEFN